MSDTKTKKEDNQNQSKPAENSQADEAQAILKKMEAKKEANPDECVFC